MSISARTKRAAVYAYSDAGSDGVIASLYLPVQSGDADGRWWVSVAVPSGREYALASRASQTADAVLGFAGEVPLTEAGAIEIGGQFYRILAILPRDTGQDERQVLAVFADAADFEIAA